MLEQILVVKTNRPKGNYNRHLSMYVSEMRETKIRHIVVEDQRVSIANNGPVKLLGTPIGVLHPHGA